MRNRIYMDHAATTAVLPEVMEAMTPYFAESFGNPSGVYATGREAHRALDLARKRAAEAIGALPEEIYFTSGGSESDSWALIGAAFAGRARGNHLITSSVEHHAVLHTCRWLEKQGFQVTYLPVDSFGRVDPEELERAVRPETILISVMAANNEIGTLQPVERIGETARARGIPFHTDAVQAMGVLPVDVNRWKADMLSLSAHKFHGPKGTGLLYVRKGIRLDSLIHGGAQERGMRAGTENTAGIAGMGKAMELAAAGVRERAEKIRRLRDMLIRGLEETVPGIRLNGHPTERLPGNAHFSIPGADGEAALLRMDLAGIAVSGGSACTSGSTEPSHVLRAIGLDAGAAEGGLRITLGEENTGEEIGEVLRVLPAIVRELRESNPKFH